jgi:acetolactate synthase-1/2/3 large subunit
MLAVGCRFADETTSSYRPGHALSIPPTKLIHVDIDAEEIGKNYPVEVGIVGDARATLAALVEAVRAIKPEAASLQGGYVEEIRRLRAEWSEKTREARESDAVPMTISRMLKEAQELLPPEAIIVHSSGNTQAQILQEWTFTVPGTSVTTAGFSTMGWTLPAALGAKLAAPERPVVGIVGDGDLLMTIQELATAAQYGVPVTVLVANNIGWIAIKDLQCAAYGEEHVMAVDFAARDGQVVTPNLAGIARAFGCYGERIEAPGDVKPALQRALESGGPAVVECLVARDFPASGGAAYGWWDVPVPTYLAEARARYEAESSEELLG